MIEIRQGIKADIPEIIEFLMLMHAQNKTDWFEVMADGRHPNNDVSNFMIAKDNDKIIALTIFQPMNYSYCGIIIKGTRLEEVFCEPEYQYKGIPKKILDEIAERIEKKGSLLELVFVGMYSFFDSLGYTFGIPCEGEGYTYVVNDEETKNDFSIEEASDDDIPIITKLHEKVYKRNILTTALSCSEINYIKNLYNASAPYPSKFYIIKSAEGKVCGFFLTQLKSKSIYMMELNDDCSYHQIRPYLIKFYMSHGLNKISAMFGKAHPIYIVFKGFYHQKSLPEFGFVKVNNIPKFLMSVFHVLNGRLANSPYAHLTSSFTVAMRNNGEAYRFEFIGGKLHNITPVNENFGQVYIERDKFIKMLFGRTSPTGLEGEAYQYNYENEDYRNIFEILFPKMTSHIISLN